MGMFDYLSVDDDSRFTCPGGHQLCSESFQSKSFECVLGEVRISQGRLDRDTFGVDELAAIPKRPYHGTFRMYTDCSQCPCYFDTPSGNVWYLWVEFEVEVAGDVVFAVRRVSGSTAEFHAGAAARNLQGPLTLEEAVNLRDAHMRKVFGR